MLTKKVLNEATIVADSVSYGNKYLEPKAGTPLHDLVSSVDGHNDNGSYENIISNSDIVTGSRGKHEDIQRRTTLTASRIIGNIINHARNVINPYCRELLTDIETSKVNLLSDSIANIGTVVQIEMMPLFTDEMFQQLIGLYAGISIREPSDIDKIVSSLNGYFTTAEVAELIQTGSSILDKRVSSYISNTEVEFYNLSNIHHNSLDVNIALFMAITGILNGRSDKAHSVTDDSSIAADLNLLKAKLGTYINRVIESLIASTDNGDLVAVGLFVPKDTYHKAYVIGKNYRDWIKNSGGSPEAILGYVIKSGGNYNGEMARQLIDNASEYTKVYSNRVTAIKSTQELASINNVRSVINGTISKTIASMDVTDDEKVVLHGRLNTAMKDEYYGNTVLVPYVRKIVCSVMSEGDDVMMILTEVDNALAMQDEPDMDAAVYHATVRLTCRWIGRQIYTARS